MAEVSKDFGPRVKGALIIKPIVYGNCARHLGQAREDGHTHEWTVYLRSYNNEDMSAYIKRVQIKLHDSYHNSNRILTQPPYEVVETGWGEFGINIKIYFVDPTERPVTIFHLLKLFKHGAPGQIIVTDYLVSESYDELVFAEPSETMHKLLTSAPSLPPQLSIKFETDFDAEREKTMESILTAKNSIRQEIDDLRQRIQATKSEIGKYKDEISMKEEE